MTEKQSVSDDSGIVLPSDFYSSETGKPFTRCNVCDVNLLIPGTRYVIEKAITHNKEYHTTDTIFEYALCYNCYREILGTMSETSLKNIQSYFLDHTEHVQRRLMQFIQGKANVEELIGACAIKGTAREQLSEYQIACHCNGRNLDSTYPPLMIGHEAMDEIMLLLSDKTLGEIDGFYNDIIKIPPEFKDILDGRPVFIL
jgi:hypothetical protein